MSPASLANLIAAREDRMDAILEGNSPYAIAYRELVAEYGADLVAQAMYVVEHDNDTRIIAEIARRHTARMHMLAGLTANGPSRTHRQHTQERAA